MNTTSTNTPTFENGHFLGEYIEPGRDAVSFEERRQWHKDVEDKVARSPRYTWALVRKEWTHEGQQRVSFETLISDGTGQLATGGKFDVYEERPTYEHIRNLMTGYEEYEEGQRQQNLAYLKSKKDAVKQKGLRPGITLRDIELFIHGERHKFATFLIMEVTEDGMVKASATKRGSRQRYTVQVPATEDNIPSLNQETDFGLFALQ